MQLIVDVLCLVNMPMWLLLPERPHAGADSGPRPNETKTILKVSLNPLHVSSGASAESC